MDNKIDLVAIKEERDLMLRTGLSIADKFINKKYLIDLSDSEVMELPDYEEEKRLIRLFRLDKLIYDENENINDKLISVYSALQEINSTVFLLVEGTANSTSFYIGVKEKNNITIADKVLEKSFIGNFPGSTLTRINKASEIRRIVDNIGRTENNDLCKNVSSITVVPAPRDEDKEKFVQGLEKYIDTMQGQIYNALFIAEPVNKEQLEERKKGLEELYSSLSPLAKVSLAYGENENSSVSKSVFDNFSTSVNESVSKTIGFSSNGNFGMNSGSNTSGGLNLFGFGLNGGSSSGSSLGLSGGPSLSKTTSKGITATVGHGSSYADTASTGSSNTMTIEQENKAITNMLDKIDEQLERIKSCEAFGIWECAGYFVAESIETSAMAASTFKALMIGDDTDVENSYFNIWSSENKSGNTKKVLEYLTCGRHPVIEIEPPQGMGNLYAKQYVTPGNYISGKELPLFLGVPHKSIAGLAISSVASFGRNVIVQSRTKESKKIRIGSIHHMGETEKTEVKLDLDSFSSHCFITGSTGSGKSNTVYGLLEKFMENDIPFLIVEPAKGEYKDVFGAVENINIFTTNSLIGQMLKLNPFRFDPGIHILEHLDRLIEIFNACWEMYAAMPAILKDAVEKSYIEKGWDLLNSIYLGEGDPVYPTFSDLMQVLPKVINESSYSADTKGDYTGALVTRVTSLTNGISGQIFCDSYDIPDSTFFDENTIVDLSRVGSTETKSLIMGILVLKLSEYRMANANESNSKLRHITVLEEAHNLLKKVDSSTAGGNVVKKSVEMICNSIAEMRTYGEGFVIVDQSPTAVDIAAIKNTNTKILMRLPEKTDCQTAGNAVGLNDEQIAEMSKLPTGIAVVMQNNWLEAVLTHIDAYSNKYEKKINPVLFDELRILRGNVIEELMNQYIRDKEISLEHMYDVIENTEISSLKKKEMKYCMKYTLSRLEKGRDIEFFTTSLLNISCTKNLIKTLESKIKKNDQPDEYEIKEWKNRFRKELEKYISLPPAYNNSIIPYLVHAQNVEQNGIDYVAVERKLIEKMNKPF